MIADCRDANLPEPDFEQRGPHFVVTIWRDWLTDKVLAELGLSSRQREMVEFVKIRGKVSNADCQQEWGVSRNTASRDLEALCRRDVLLKKGTTGKGTHYILIRKRTKHTMKMNAPQTHQTHHK